MTEKKFAFKNFEISKTKRFLNEVKLYEIDMNHSDDLDESNLFYVYSDSKDNIIQIVNRLNELYEENEELKELIKLIADADSYREENSVKEILRNEIWGIDSVAGEYSSAWHDCVILSNFFEKYYGEHWDNDKFD